MSSEKLIQTIKDICQEHLDNTDIDNIALCEDFHDHYLLGKVDMATEIFEAIMKGKKKKKQDKHDLLIDKMYEKVEQQINKKEKVKDE